MPAPRVQTPAAARCCPAYRKPGVVVCLTRPIKTNGMQYTLTCVCLQNRGVRPLRPVHPRQQRGRGPDVGGCGNGLQGGRSGTPDVALVELV
jgi:hypothetical protein